MRLYGIDVTYKSVPKLDKDFIPINLFNRAYLEGAAKPLKLAIERTGGVAVCETKIYATAEYAEADRYYIDRAVKNILWTKGGYRLYVCGDRSIYEYLKETYSPDGSRSFDFDFMSTVYERPFEVVLCAEKDMPKEKESAQAVGGFLNGCRIGFDAGGSDRKVSAVIDGETVYSEETVWFPKTRRDWKYHYDGIVSAMKAAAAHMPRVDAIGISSAGVYVDNKTMVASLFLKVPKEDFDEHVKTIFTDAAKEVADVPTVVCNDGDVSALAGGMGLKKNNVLGIAMGTSEAVGFLDKNGHITGWLNELAFAPVDANPSAMRDEWSTDIGVGCKYFSQDAVIKLANAAGIEFKKRTSPAERLKVIQALLSSDDKRAWEVFESIGVYLGHTLAYYYETYGCEYVLLMGRVMSGTGGEIILSAAKKVLFEEYPEVAKYLSAELPDEKSRRVGQSVAAASLPRIN